MSLITVAGMLGGLAMVLIARRGRRMAKQLLIDERAGLVGPREIAQAQVQQKQRSLRLGQAICAFVALLLVAVLGRAAVSGDWGGTTTYYAVLFGILLVVSALTLRKVANDVSEARARLEHPPNH